MAYGWQARLLNIDGHEVCEVWNDDYAKWVYLDASNVNHYQCDIETGEPMSFLEIHNAYMDYFYPDRIMDWLNDYHAQVLKKIGPRLEDDEDRKWLEAACAPVNPATS